MHRWRAVLGPFAPPDGGIAVTASVGEVSLGEVSSLMSSASLSLPSPGEVTAASGFRRKSAFAVSEPGEREALLSSGEVNSGSEPWLLALASPVPTWEPEPGEVVEVTQGDEQSDRPDVSTGEVLGETGSQEDAEAGEVAASEVAWSCNLRGRCSLAVPSDSSGEVPPSRPPTPPLPALP